AAPPLADLAVELGEGALGGRAVAIAHHERDQGLGELHLIVDRRPSGPVDQAAARLRDLRLAATEDPVDAAGDPLDLPDGLAELGEPPLHAVPEDRLDLAREAGQAEHGSPAHRDLE